MPAPMDAANPTTKASQVLCVANAAANTGASVELRADGNEVSAASHSHLVQGSANGGLLAGRMEPGPLPFLVMVVKIPG